MSTPKTPLLKDGDHCLVVAGTHKGKSGIARNLNISKTGHLTITVVGERRALRRWRGTWWCRPSVDDR